MAYDPNIPIENYVMMALTERSFQCITDSWPVKLETIHQVVVKHFHDLGVFYVQPYDHAEIIKDQIVQILKNSPILVELVDKGKRQAILNANRGRGGLDR